MVKTRSGRGLEVAHASSAHGQSRKQKRDECSSAHHRCARESRDTEAREAAGSSGSNRKKVAPPLSADSDARPSLESLATTVIEDIVSRLPLRSVWALWQVSRALRSAVKRCQWQHPLVLHRASSGELTADFDGLAATRMFTLGGISSVTTVAHMDGNRQPACRAPCCALPNGGPIVDLSSFAPLVRCLEMRWDDVGYGFGPVSCDAADVMRLSNLRELKLVGSPASRLLQLCASGLAGLTSLSFVRPQFLSLGNTASHLVWRSLEMLRVVGRLERMEKPCGVPWASCVRLREVEILEDNMHEYHEFELWQLAALPLLERLTLRVKGFSFPSREEGEGDVEFFLQRLTFLEVHFGNSTVRLPLNAFPSLVELVLHMEYGRDPQFLGSVSSMPHLTKFSCLGRRAKRARIPLADFSQLRRLKEVTAPLHLFPLPRDFSALRHVPKVVLRAVTSAVDGLNPRRFDLSTLASVCELHLLDALSMSLKAETVDALTCLRTLVVVTEEKDKARHPVVIGKGGAHGKAGGCGSGAGNSVGRPGGGGGGSSVRSLGVNGDGYGDGSSETIHELAWVAGAAVLECLTLDAVYVDAKFYYAYGDDEEEDEHDFKAARQRRTDAHTFVRYRVVRWSAGKEMPRLRELRLSGFHSLGFSSSLTTCAFPQLRFLCLRRMQWERMDDVLEGALPQLRRLRVVENPRLRFIAPAWFRLPSLKHVELVGNPMLEVSVHPCGGRLGRSCGDTPSR